MNKQHSTISKALMTLLLLITPFTMWAQGTNPKFSMTTNMFLDKIQQAEQPADESQLAPSHFQLKHKPQPLIVSPDTIDDIVYVTCFIHLTDPTNLTEVEALGVLINETFEGLNFVTARVPVSQLEALAAIDNVTKIKVAQRMRPTTDAARQQTNVQDLLTLSSAATTQGITTKYDGTGVVLGVVDAGIDFQHIAFKDKNGNSRIKRAYVYTGSGTGHEYSSISGLTTDINNEDHGTHTSSIAGGSSVIVNKVSNSNFTVTVTDDHANATFGGMAPGSDLYLAGVCDFSDAEIFSAYNKMIQYADANNQPLVINNSWGSSWGPRNGMGEYADYVAQNFGDDHPNHIILFASSNSAGLASSNNENGGLFIQKSAATSSSPLGSICHTDSYSGDYYVDLIAVAWANAPIQGKIHVLDNTTGAILQTKTITPNTNEVSFSYPYYSGSITLYGSVDNGYHQLAFYSGGYGVNSYSDGSYTLAFEIYPQSGSADIRMWGGDYNYFVNNLTTPGHTWQLGTDDMSVSDEATIPDGIAVGAYVSKSDVTNYQGNLYHYSAGDLGDIAYFSSYSTANLNPNGEVLPWITAPGAQLVAAVNHYHTTSVDSYSYFGQNSKRYLVVNNTNNPYASMQGTSMATPAAAGIVAQWLQAANSLGKTLSTSEVKTIMAETAIKDSYCTSGPNASHFGNGKINALAGIHYILENYSGGVTPVPPVSLSPRYEKITNASSLDAGDKILIAYVNGDDRLALSTTQNTNNRAATTDVTLNSDGTLTPGTNAQIITLEMQNNHFLFNVGNGYLYAAASDKNWLRTKTTPDANAEATISISEGDATVVFQGSNTRNNLRYNPNTQNNAPLFSCYASSSTQALPQIYREIPVIQLNNDGTGNAETIAANAGKKVTAVLSDRILFKDDSWNTLCLPFAVSNFAGTPLEGATVKTLTQAAYNEATGTLTLTFSEPLSAIEAGKPYLVKWPVGEDITSPAFQDVTISSAANNIQTSYIDFIGCTTPVVLAANDNTRLFLSTDNLLYWPDTDVTINACRAYFALKGLTAGQPAAGAPELRIVLNLDGEDTTTDFDLSPFNFQFSTTKFLLGGHLYILRDGITYDALGRIVK